MQRQLLLVATLLLAAPAAALAQGVPGSVSFTARLADDGVPVNGTRIIRLTLYATPSGGASLWTETHADVGVDDGLLYLQMGSLTALDGFTLDGTDRWLQVTVDGTDMSPRLQIASVPYAIRAGIAADSDQLGGMDPSDFVSQVDTPASNGLTSSVDNGVATVGLISCAANQVLRSTGAGWQCDYVGGFNPPYVQYDTGWFAASHYLQASLAHGVTGFDFAFGWIRGRDETGAEIIMPSMGGEAPDYATAYNQLDSTTVGFQLWDALTAINNPGDRNNLHIIDGEMRLTIIDRTPSWDSGWQACAANNTYNYLHSLGTLPHFAHVEVAENADGSGWRVPTMSANNYWSPNWRQTAIVSLSSTNVVLRTHTSLAYFYRNGAATAPSTGYCRIRLYVWTPDYDSDWVLNTTASANRDKLFQHDLGQMPSLVNLYIAQNSDGSGWLVPSLGAFHHSYSYSTGIYHVSNKFAVIKGGASVVAHFVDSAGTGQGPTSGYLRFMAWR